MSGMIAEIIKRPHPVLVHFPISLFPISLFFVILFWLFGNPLMLLASYWSFLLAVLLVIPTAITGWIDMKRLSHIADQAKDHLRKHYINGVAITLISIVTGIFFLFQSPFITRGMFVLYVLDLLVLTALVGWQGYLGANLVYSHRLGVEGDTR